MSLEKWQSEIDKRIQDMLSEAEQDGQIEKGKRLTFDLDSNTPDDRRVAYKIMKDNDVYPDWISLGKDLDKAEATLRADIKRAAAAYSSAIFRAERDGLGNIRDRAEKRWQSDQHTLQDRAKRYNDRVLTYNLKVPNGIKHRPLIDLMREVDRELAL